MTHSHHSKHHQQHRKRWRQSKHDGDDCYFPSHHAELYPTVSSAIVPTAANKWMDPPHHPHPPSHSMMTNNRPPPPLQPQHPRVEYCSTYHQYPSSSQPPPKTPPFRRRNTGESQPISPPNPLRLATTNNVDRGLPTPVSSSFSSSSYFVRGSSFLSSSPPPPPPPLHAIRIGPPEMQVYKIKLPNILIDGLSHIIDRSEQHVQNLSDGWRTELYSLTKCDIACRDIPGLYEYVKPISKYISYTMKVLYGCRDVTVDKNQPHILKYSAEAGYTGVELHHDRCDITANLALSRSDTYVGGGTTIAAIGQVVRLELGEVLLHPGSMVHGGNHITAGTRYLMVTFADLKR